MAGLVSGDPDPQRPELVGEERIAPCWGMSSLDWQSHAIDESADRLYGVYVARCVQRVFMGASLYDEAPAGCAYPACAGPSGGTPTRGPSRPRRARGVRKAGWGEPPGALGAVPAGLPRPPTAACGRPFSRRPQGPVRRVMITGFTQHDHPPPGLRCQRWHLIFLTNSNTRGPRDE